MVRVSQTNAEDQEVIEQSHGRASSENLWPGWIPFLVLPVAAIAVRPFLESWCFMWTLAAAIFYGCKWQTWWERRKIAGAATTRSLGYLLAWPGMDAEAFLDRQRSARRTVLKEWAWASAKTTFGAILLWVVARRVAEGNEMLAGWACWESSSSCTSGRSTSCL